MGGFQRVPTRWRLKKWWGPFFFFFKFPRWHFKYSLKMPLPIIKYRDNRFIVWFWDGPERKLKWGNSKRGLYIWLCKGKFKNIFSGGISQLAVYILASAASWDQKLIPHWHFRTLMLSLIWVSSIILILSLAI